jgi:hypothetical protein
MPEEPARLVGRRQLACDVYVAVVADDITGGTELQISIAGAETKEAPGEFWYSVSSGSGKVSISNDRYNAMAEAIFQAGVHDRLPRCQFGRRPLAAGRWPLAAGPHDFRGSCKTAALAACLEARGDGGRHQLRGSVPGLRTARYGRSDRAGFLQTWVRVGKQLPAA